MWCGAQLAPVATQPQAQPQYEYGQQPGPGPQALPGGQPLPTYGPQYGQQISGSYPPPPFYPQAAPPTRSGGVPVWLWVVLGLIVVCGVLAVVGTIATQNMISTFTGGRLPSGTTSGGSTSGGTTSGGSSSSNAGTPIGVTKEIDGLKLTVNSVRHERSGLFDAKAGSEYVILNMTFENTTSAAKAVSSLLEYSLHDDANHKYTISFTADTKNNLDGAVPTGKAISGETAFEVPTSATGLTFVYTPFTGSNSLEFKLDR